MASSKPKHSEPCPTKPAATLFLYSAKPVSIRGLPYSSKKALEEAKALPENRNIIEALTDYKTHLDGSIFLITNVKKAKEYFDQTFIN